MSVREEVAPALLRLPANAQGRDFVVGDVHGHLAPLFRLMDCIQFDPGMDRLFSVGDLIDRGPKSMEALRLVEEPWFYAVLGNHEAMLQSYLRVAAWDTHSPMDFLRNGGQWVLDYLADADAEWELRHLLCQMPLAIEVGEGTNCFRVVHAELPGRQPAGALLPEELDASRGDVVWSRDRAERGVSLCWPQQGQLWDAGGHRPDLPLVVSGHSVLPYPMFFENQLFIDTGSYGRVLEVGGSLTLVEPVRFLQGIKAGASSLARLGLHHV